jgi:mediator of RNA polymerase II transcription subunit 10
MNREITNLMASLLEINRRAPSLDVYLPPEVITYVQEGRNPDIYTREFVELGMRNNQRLRGKTAAFAQFRDIFAGEISGGVPELGSDVSKVVSDVKAEAV